MRLSKTRKSRAQGRQRPLAASTLVTAGLALTVTGGVARAAEIPSGNSDVSIRWDNTVKYSTAARIEDRSGKVEGVDQNNNLDDGDRNFDKGLISNRVDLLSEVDLVYKNRYGVRVSGAAWYDSVYNQGNDNDFAGSTNNVSVNNDSFTSETKKLHGRNAELLDAFAFGKFDLPNEMRLNMRGGRFAQLYGESLFMGANGVAAAQGPIDVVKALSVPNSQFKEIMMPVGQVSSQLQVNEDWAVGAYYQFEYRKNRLPAAGSYFSNGDILDDGGESLYGAGSGPGGAYFSRGNDIEAKDSGQGGFQVRWKANPNLDLGAYFAQFHDKSPKVYLRLSGGATTTSHGTDVGDYMLVYPENIRVYGASFGTTVGETNVSGEVSMRTNQPLASANGDIMLDSTNDHDNNGNPLYAVGRTLHANLSAISVGGGSAIWDGITMTSELAYNRLLDVTNGRPLDPDVSYGAMAGRMVIEPSYFQVIPGLDVTVPVGLGYGIFGHSALGPTVFNPEGVGDVSIGVKGVYENTWNVALNLTHYMGKSGQLTSTTNRYYSYDQYFADRDFVSFSVQRSF